MTTRSGHAGQLRDAGPDALTSERHRLIGLTYRLLGSLTEAEDAVQETYARWYAMSPEQQDAVECPGAWFTTVASRVCLNLLGSARARREVYTGEWLPEPVPGTVGWISVQSAVVTDPVDQVTLAESVSMAFLVMLEAMTPAERVALILHDVFGYPLEARDIKRLIGLLDPDATATTDSGGLVPAAPQPVRGSEQIVRYSVGVLDRQPGLTALERIVNGQPGIVVQHHGITAAVLAFHIAGDRIKHIWAVRNPDKLRPWMAA